MSRREIELTDAFIRLAAAIDCHKNPCACDPDRNFIPVYQIEPKDKLLYNTCDALWEKVNQFMVFEH
jgi:hypothetical protein